MFKKLWVELQTMAFIFLAYLLRKLCPTVFIFGRLRSHKTISVAEGRKDLFMVSFTEIMTGNKDMDPLIDKSLELARLRSAGMNDEKIFKEIKEFLKGK